MFSRSLFQSNILGSVSKGEGGGVNTVSRRYYFSLGHMDTGSFGIYFL